MPTTPVTYVLEQLDRTLTELGEAHDRRDEQTEWIRCVTALTLLHQLDEAGQKPDRSTYLAARAAIPEGQTLGALIGSAPRWTTS